MSSEAISIIGSYVVIDLPDLEVLVGDLPLDDSLEVDDFFDGSDSLVLLLLVFLPWFSPTERSGSGIIVTGGVSLLIGGVRIGVVVYSSTCDMMETEGGGRRFIAGATKGISDIADAQIRIIQLRSSLVSFKIESFFIIKIIIVFPSLHQATAGKWVQQLVDSQGAMLHYYLADLIHQSNHISFSLILNQR
ncbi:hypothetical protein Tco_0946703 [Tanacetum coccineum]